MRILANILWHIPFLGFINAFIMFIIGGLFTITVIGAPIGLGLMQLSKFLLTPFSSTMVDSNEFKKDADKNKLWQSFGLIIRIIWFPIGLALAVVTIVQIAGLFITIIGIPVAIVLAKSLSTYFNPVNKKCVPRAVAEEMKQRKAKAYVDTTNA